MKNGKVDLHQAYNEVNRRALEINCDNFECSFKRFKNLATECNNITVGIICEVITVLEGEMRNFYKNSSRYDYGHNVKGPDFRVDGIGKI